MDEVVKKMREILFRGKNVITGEWVTGMNVFFACDAERTKFRCLMTQSGSHIEHNLVDTPDGRVWRHELPSVEVDVKTIGQHIGLTDKTGAKIFEGDIVSGPDFDDEDGFGVVLYDEQTARFVIEGNHLTVDFDSYYGSDVEVIGNVHDDPELIGGAEE